MTSILERPFFVFVRGVILIVAVVAIPLVAIFWGGPPAWLKNVTGWHTEKIEPLSAVFSTTALTEIEDGTMQSDPRAVRTLHPDRSFANEPAPQFTPLISPAVTSVAPVITDANDLATQQRLVADLENLGAQYYRLENWGDNGTLYRLSCLVSPPGVASYQKHFQVIDDAPTKALRQAITQIQQWHATTQSTAADDTTDATDKTW